jgi:hypothetical protein
MIVHPLLQSGYLHQDWMSLGVFMFIIVAIFGSSLRALFRKRILHTIIASPTGLTIQDETGTRTIAKDLFLRVIVSAPRRGRMWILLAAPHAKPPTRSFQLAKQWKQIPESGIVLIAHEDRDLLLRAADVINAQFFPRKRVAI